MIAYRHNTKRPANLPAYCYYQDHYLYYTNRGGQRVCAECHPAPDGETVRDVRAEKRGFRDTMDAERTVNG